MRENYYIGLDMGVASCGWAVTDEEYHLLRAKGKDMWGVRLFSEADTAMDRRTYRIARRRLERKKARIGYLREFFSEEILKIDSAFYQRMDDSKYYLEDKNEKQPFALFADSTYTDKDYYSEFPTIFHLRKKLIETDEKQDIRLIYLAILNMFKHRGHFLNANLNDGEIGNLKNLYGILVSSVKEYAEIEFPEEIDLAELEEILSSKQFTSTQKAEKILIYMGWTRSKNKIQNEIIRMICGLKGTISKIFIEDEFDEEGKKLSVSFREGNFEEKCDQVEGILSEQAYEIFLILKQMHDWGVLANIMKGEAKTYEYLSFARVDSYDKHKYDLECLKKVFKLYKPKKYAEMFRVMKKDNYSAYVGSVNSGQEISRRVAKTKSEDFYKNIKKIIKEMPEDENTTYILDEIEKGTFLPKQLTASNGVIPNQVHKKELKKILQNAQKHYGFLLQKDESGLSISEKIIKLFEFQIPYYIGPLKNIDGKGNGWVVRKELGRVLPWNFDEKIDRKQSAEKFIQKMVNHCTYLNNETVLPKSSLLYEKYMVLNELNNLKINDQNISVELKQDLYRDLFIKGKKVTKKKLVQYLKINGIIEKEEESKISGIDGDFVNTLSNYKKFLEIFQVDILTYEQEQMAEQIVLWSTIYGDSKSFLREKIEDAYAEVLSQNQIKRILGLKFKDWGRFSKEFLLQIGADKETGEIQTIISRMWNENYNLMQLLSSRFTYEEAIKEKSMKIEKTLLEIEYSDLEGMYLSAPVKRMVWQTILLLKEIYQIMGYAPKRIFVEMARDNNAEKKRTSSRKNKLISLYKNCKDESRNWIAELEKENESKFRSKKLYLYYTQKGRCMYTNEIIEMKDLFNDNRYDIDHIYPRHFIKDDSIENNLVLVKKEINGHKSDTFPIEREIQRKQRDWWKSLREGKFISEEKYQRLIRQTKFSDDEMANFVNRQIVETRQGTKVITELFKKIFSESEIVYTKAANVSQFRQQFDMIKCRTLNNFHHAQDAYLNIVVGNVYFTKFTRNPVNFIREYKKDPIKNAYHMYKLFYSTVQRNNNIVWYAGDITGKKSIDIVRKIMKKNTPIITRMNYEEHGGLADQTIYKAKEALKAKGIGYIPIKATDKKLKDTTKYGGYNKFTGTYFFLVEHTVKKKRIRTLETMPLYLKERLDTKQKLEEYCKERLELVDPDIRMERIKMYSLLKVDGFYLYLTGRSNQRLLVSNAVELVVSYLVAKYIKTLVNLTERNYTEKQMEESGRISKEENIHLYNELTEKHLYRIYKNRPNPVGEKLLMGKEKFIKLNLKEQVYILLQILQLAQSSNVGADLSLIGESKRTGVATLNKKISECKEFTLINRSITGLYESKIDLLTV